MNEFKIFILLERVIDLSCFSRFAQIVYRWRYESSSLQVSCKKQQCLVRFLFISLQDLHRLVRNLQDKQEISTSRLGK